ncbi:hypothetical protein C0995_014048 [Termitomyces sp. Mi166|nr:hypothetical protein C0995_014048 [Termitomyces sp. Mi166\
MASIPPDLYDLAKLVALSSKWLIEAVYEESTTTIPMLYRFFRDRDMIEDAFNTKYSEIMNDPLQRQYELQKLITRRAFPPDIQKRTPRALVCYILQELVLERPEYARHPWKKHFDKIIFSMIGLAHFRQFWRREWSSLSSNDQSAFVKELQQGFKDTFTGFHIQHNTGGTQWFQLLPDVHFNILANGLAVHFQFKGYDPISLYFTNVPFGNGVFVPTLKLYSEHPRDQEISLAWEGGQRVVIHRPRLNRRG